ncbi:DUF1351 domain-containing protein [Ligilactobacillus equi]
MNDLTTVAKNVSIRWEVPGTPTIENYEEIKKLAESIAEQYSNQIITADTKKSATDSRKELNALSKALDEKRKEPLRKSKEAIKPYEDKVKELRTIIGGALGYIKAGLDELDKKERAEKEIKVKALVKEVATADGIDPERIEINSKWLNASAKRKDIVAGIQSEMQRLKLRDSEMALIESEALRLKVDPQPYLEDFFNRADMGLTAKDVINTMHEHIENTKAIEREKQARMEAEKAEMTKVSDDEFATKYGEKKVLKQEVSFTIRGTEKDVNKAAKFIKDLQGIEVVSASERKEVWG